MLSPSWPPPGPRCHASCSSGLHRNLCPLVSNCLTLDFLTLLSLVRAQAGLRPVPAFSLPGPGAFPRSTALNHRFFSPHALSPSTHWRQPHRVLTPTAEQTGCPSASQWKPGGSLSHHTQRGQDGKGLMGPSTSSCLLGA